METEKTTLNKLPALGAEYEFVATSVNCTYWESGNIYTTLKNGDLMRVIQQEGKWKLQVFDVRGEWSTFFHHHDKSEVTYQFIRYYRNDSGAGV